MIRKRLRAYRFRKFQKRAMDEHLVKIQNELANEIREERRAKGK